MSAHDYATTLQNVRSVMERSASGIQLGLQRIVTATRWLAAARLDDARVAAARLDPDLPLGADRDLAMVYAYGLEAVSSCGPDERAVLVRASMLLEHDLPAADVANALGAWAQRYPELIGSAPRVHVRTPHGYRAEWTGSGEHLGPRLDPDQHAAVLEAARGAWS